MTLNASWHRRHPMPKNPSLGQRLAWHVEHEKQCSCRPIPAKLLTAMGVGPARATAKARGKSEVSAAALDRFFEGRRIARRLFASVERAVKAAGPSTMRVTRAQIAFRRRRAFAWAWTPDRWSKGKAAPLVVSVALSRRDRSRRWKEVVESTHGRWMHHLELQSSRDVDAEVRRWLLEAWEAAQDRGAGATPSRGRSGAVEAWQRGVVI